MSMIFLGIMAMFLLASVMATYVVVTATFVMALVVLFKGLGRDPDAAPAKSPPLVRIPVMRVVKDVPEPPNMRYRRTLLEIAVKEAELEEVERRILIAHAEARKLDLMQEIAELTAADRTRAGDLTADLWLLKADKDEFESDPDVMKLDALAGYPMR